MATHPRSRTSKPPRGSPPKRSGRSQRRAVLGVLIALLSPVLGGLYYFFSTTYYPQDLVMIESIYQIVSHAIQGAVAAAIYKTV